MLLAGDFWIARWCKMLPSKGLSPYWFLLYPVCAAESMMTVCKLCVGKVRNLYAKLAPSLARIRHPRNSSRASPPRQRCGSVKPAACKIKRFFPSLSPYQQVPPLRPQPPQHLPAQYAAGTPASLRARDESPEHRRAIRDPNPAHRAGIMFSISTKDRKRRSADRVGHGTT